MSDNEIINTSGGQEDLKQYQGNEGIVSRWLKEIELVENSKQQKAFENIGEKIVKNYRNADALQEYTGQTLKPTRVMFNVLWSNVQVLKPSLYSRMPKVVVERRFKDSDPIGRTASNIGERATSFMLTTQQDRFNTAVKGAVEDRLLPGRGQVWLRYDADFEDSVDENGEIITDETGNPIRTPKANTEKVEIDPLTWTDYFHSPARNPYEIRWMAKRCYMTRNKLKKRFGEIGQYVELTHNPSGSKRNKLNNEEQEFLLQAEVWEIWDKESKKVYWISKGYKQAPLDVKDDPLKLKEFWPCPYPLLATTTTDTMYPTPDYKIYERLADELDYVTKRISAIVECIRFVGATAAQFNTDVKNILKLNDGQLWPIEGWVNWAEKGGLKGAIDWLPFDQCVAALGPLQEYQQALLSQIFEITGIPDIVRGATDPNETLGAQNHKIRWVGIKAEEKAADVQRFCREIIQKVSEIIFEPGLFSDETIMLMCGYEQMSEEDKANFPAALELLRSDRLRTFRVDIETDSTIATDEESDKQARLEFIQSVNQLLGSVESIKAQAPELLAPMVQSVLFALRPFRTARVLEGAWENALTQMEQAQKEAAMRPPELTPEEIAQQMESQKLQLQSQEIQVRSQEAMQKMQTEGQKLQFEQWLEGQRLELDARKQAMDFELRAQEVQIKGLQVQSEAQARQTDQELEAFKNRFSAFVEQQKLELEKFYTTLDMKEKFMEEERLKRDTEIEQLKLLVSSKPAESEKKDSIPQIHIHNTGADKEIVMSRAPDGSLIGRSRRVEASA